MNFIIREIRQDEREFVNASIIKHWQETRLGYVDTFIETATLPALVAIADDRVVGALTWRLHNNAFQIVTLTSEIEGQGVGSALMIAAENEARRRKIGRILLSVDNDSMKALRFYQRRNYHLHELHRNVVAHLRALKPSIPERGEDNIALRDQLDLIKDLAPDF